MKTKRKWQFLNGLHLKIIAIVTMTCDHAWVCGVVNAMAFTVIGRLSFPIFAFLVAEGAKHTRDMGKYLKRMVLFAVISEIPFNLMAGGQWRYPHHQNVLWTFAIALAVILLAGWQKTPFRRYLVLIAGAVVGFLLGTMAMVDYLGYGVVEVLLFYVFHDLRYGFLPEIAGVVYINWIMLAGMTISVCGVDIPLQGIACLSLIPIFFYNGEKGHGNRALQIGFYAYYPLHILILALLGLYVM